MTLGTVTITRETRKACFFSFEIVNHYNISYLNLLYEKIDIQNLRHYPAFCLKKYYSFPSFYILTIAKIVQYSHSRELVSQILLLHHLHESPTPYSSLVLDQIHRHPSHRLRYSCFFLLIE